ncbi:peptidase E [Streptomyces sp. MST-110588]|uniref:Type 1 glutamine amidotransferase-like domain-containing protein n=1 Tax=Streptomyces sp. MST-110588 TaxID=2833628 RepID=UPI001F5C96C2|nr:peptidase E [Streptomyces sp. MST-110588]UNO42799.1 peptidase E [Streptomyces sp. MST-110588]
MAASRRIVLLGGGFSTDPDTLLDDFVLRAAGRERPGVCFLPTASGDAQGYIDRFHDVLGGRGDCGTVHLPLFRRTDADLRSLILSQDVVYVGGGSTANLLALWRLHGLDEILREAYASGVLLCGISAGACCWFQGCLTDSFGPLRPLADGLGLLPGSLCPHYDSEPGRRCGYRSALAAGALPGGWALDDGAAALFVDGHLAEAVTRKEGASLHRVVTDAAAGGCAVREEALPARLLTARGPGPTAGPGAPTAAITSP